MRSVRSDEGYATAEAAVVLPVLLVVLAMAVWVLACVGAQLRCLDAAGVGARAAARGQSAAEVGRASAQAGPSGAVVEVRTGAEQVEVLVSARVRPFGGALQKLPAMAVSGRAVAAREDLVGGP